MNKIIFVMTVLAIAMTASVTMGADMVAGNPKNGANVVGTVDVSIVPPNLVVTYTITNLDYIITATHLHIATDPEDFPTSKGGAIPGHFDYSMLFEVSDNQQVVIYEIPLVDIFDGGIVPAVFYVAAHAVVGSLCPCDSYTCEDLDLPSEVTVSALYATDAGADGDSYFDATITGGTVLDGLYDAWCVDTDRSIRPQGLTRGIPLQAYVYCDCFDMPVLTAPDNPLVEYCENIPKVVWILNNVYVGQPISEINPETLCEGNITMGDIQRAIWELVDDTEEDSGLLEWSQCRVDEILAAADGEYVPICGEDIGVIILPYVWMLDTTVPADGIPDVVLVGADPAIPRYDDLPPEAVKVYVQPIIIRIPAPCCFCGMTAWAGTPIEPSHAWPDEDNDGYKYEFPGNDWSMYFSVPEDAITALSAANGKKK